MPLPPFNAVTGRPTVGCAVAVDHLSELMMRASCRVALLLSVVVFFALPAGCASPSPGPDPEVITCAAPPAGIVGWWTGDGERRSRVGTDSAIAFGKVTYDSGVVGLSFRFDSLGSYLEIPESPSVSFAGSFSIAVWLKLRVPLAAQPDFRGPGWDDYHVVVEKGRGAYTERNYGMYFSKTEDKLYFNGIDSTSLQYVFNVAVSPASLVFDDRAWHLVVATWDQTSRMATLYIDGTQAAGVAGSAEPLKTNTLPLRVGAASADGYFTDGSIDELALFDRALPAATVRALFAAGASGICRQ